MDNKDRLLDYQANSAKRTQFIVNESDYFSTDGNNWLTLEKREAMKKKKEELQAAGEAHDKAGQKDYLRLCQEDSCRANGPSIARSLALPLQARVDI